MVARLKKYLPALLLSLTIAIFYSPIIFSGKIPMPLDTIVGIYHPYRDLYSSEYPNGIPFKNFLLTDPVRQTYIWKELSVKIMTSGSVPSWNPYEMTGKPLAANIQSAVFYPLNVVFFIKPFYVAWTTYIVLQTVMALIFSFSYLRGLKLHAVPAITGAVAFSFSGYSISWLEWGNILHTGLWLPLTLLSIDKIFSAKKSNTFWYIVLAVSILSSLLAGHLQTFFYLVVISIAYAIFRWAQMGRNISKLLRFSLSFFAVFILGIPQWYPSLNFINLSLRGMDQNFQMIEGWFIPWQNLMQFFVPDFFGNPATLNYYGVWNYAEFVGYVGVITLTLAFCALLKRNTTVYFFLASLLTALIFALPTGISSLPYVLNIPLISTAQPTRLIFIVSFSLSILSAYGMQVLLDKKNTLNLKIFSPILIVGLVFLFLWAATLRNELFFNEIGQNEIAKRNLYLPTAIFAFGALLILLISKVKSLKLKKILLLSLVFLIILDLIRFGDKFTPFTSTSYLYPQTKAIDFIKSQDDLFRIASVDDRIMPPNFATHYQIQSITGYDPLYLKDYAEYIAAMEQNSPNPKPPYGFNRIITPKNYDSSMFDFLNVKYVLSLDEINSPKLSKVFEEGMTKVYRNNNYIQRVFFAEKVVESDNLEDIHGSDLSRIAYVDSYDREEVTVGKVERIEYSESKILIETQNEGNGFLVISDAYYPTWRVYVDGMPSKIYKTNHAFRGVYVPKGEHAVTMINSLF